MEEETPVVTAEKSAECYANPVSFVEGVSLYKCFFLEFYIENVALFTWPEDKTLTAKFGDCNFFQMSAPSVFYVGVSFEHAHADTAVPFREDVDVRV